MILPPHVPSSPNFRQVVRGYLRLHQLTVEGRDESPDADAVRDSLDLPWRTLTANEMEWVQDLSADLFSIGEPLAAGPKEMDSETQKNLSQAFEARWRGEWRSALRLLRQSSNYIAPALLSYLRGGVWLEAGYPEVAAVFYQHAAKSEPDNPNYAVLLLHSLQQSDPPRARELANRILQGDGLIQVHSITETV